MSRKTRIVSQIEASIIRAFIDNQYVFESIDTLYAHLLRHGINISHAMKQQQLPPESCHCDCVACQKKYVFHRIRNMRNDQGKLAIRCTGNGNARHWFFWDGLLYEATRQGGTITKAEALQQMERVLNFRSLQHRAMQLSFADVSTAIADLNSGVVFARPSLFDYLTAQEAS